MGLSVVGIPAGRIVAGDPRMGQPGKPGKHAKPDPPPKKGK